MLGSEELPEEFIEYIALIIKHFKPRRTIPTFGDETLRGLTAPIMVVIGERDAMLDAVQTRQRVSDLIPEAEIVTLPAGGHVPPDQTPRIMAFLGGEPVG
jgi:pimeloyl-ACP methyl ester carboxylesterase